METPQRNEHVQAKANQALKECYGHLPENCEMRRLAGKVFRRVAEHLYVEKPESLLEDRYSFEDAKQYLDLLRSTLNPLNPSTSYPNGGWLIFDRNFYLERIAGMPENPEEWLSFPALRTSGDFVLLALFEEQKESKLYWPIGDIDHLCSEYLRRPPLHCSEIDQLLVRTMIYQSSFRLGESLTYASLNWYTKEHARRKRLSSGLAVILYLLAAIVGLGAANDHGWWAGLLVTCVLIVLFGIADHLLNGKSRDEEANTLKAFRDINAAFLMTLKTGLSIRVLRERLTSIHDSKGTYIPDEIFSILDNAAGRGVILWNLDS